MQLRPRPPRRPNSPWGSPVRRYGVRMPAAAISLANFNMQAMLADLEALVNSESPSREVELVTANAQLLATIIEARTGIAPTLVDSPVGPHVHWKGGPEPKVLILGHHDTVHQRGSVAARPFTVNGEIATGPGVFDMKAGIIQAIHAVAALDDKSHVEMLFTSDEEIGSRLSRELLQDRARACGAALVLEPSADGGVLKTGRKGTGNYYVTVKGRASHAGLEPEKGINALLALAELLPQIAATARPDLGTTVTPTLASAGTADNVVPDIATCTVDVRVVQPGEDVRLHTDMHAIRSTIPGIEVIIEGGMNRPPLHHSASTELFALAQDVAAELNLAQVDGIEVGGGSDGNFTAAVGVQTLDGLGAVGGGAHSIDEHVVVSTLPARAALVAGLCQRLSSMAKRPPLVSVPAER